MYKIVNDISTNIKRYYIVKHTTDAVLISSCIYHLCYGFVAVVSGVNGNVVVDVIYVNGIVAVGLVTMLKRAMQISMYTP